MGKGSLTCKGLQKCFGNTMVIMNFILFYFFILEGVGQRGRGAEGDGEREPLTVLSRESMEPNARLEPMTLRP